MAEATSIPLADLRRQHESLRAEIDAAVARVLDRCDFVRGAALDELEAAFGRYLGAEFVVGVGSGTDALALALAALRLGPGDEVITAANSFVATASAILQTGATPVFADVDDETLCLSPESMREAITPRTKAVIPVHLHGHPAPMDALMALAAEHHLTVVEDAAQAHGARLGQRLCGTLGDVGCFSFFPSKNLGACGDGGALVTNDREVAHQVAMLRDHGRAGQDVAVVGRCSRLDTLQAAILLVKLHHLDAWNERRRALARRYSEGLAGCPGLRLPPVAPGVVFHHYVVRTPRRDELARFLADRGIATGVHYRRSIPDEPAYTAYARGPTRVADQSCREVLSLPLFPEMRDDEVDTVLEAVRAFARS